MADENDIELLRIFAGEQSEPAFAELVRRHLNLVYSVALRFTGNSSDAQDVAQAVFVILAQKAGKLPDRTVLTGWLYETTRFTALHWLRSQARRRMREQEATMQSITDGDNPDEVWQEIAPHLEAAMSRLGKRDRELLALRFFENQSGAEIATRLGLREDSARRRTNRALEKLRVFFRQRGVNSTTAVIAAAISANSIQPAPAALAGIVIAAGIAKGAGVSSATFTLVKGGLKIMAWTKMKAAVAVSICALVAIGGSGVLLQHAAVRANSVLRQRLDDGSTLTLSRISFGDHHPFSLGGENKPWSWPGHEQLYLEFRLDGNRGDSPLVTHPFFRQYRFLLRGESGVQFVEQFVPEFKGFARVGRTYFGNVETEIFPRDSRWLWLRLERRDDPNRYDDWRPLAEFKFPNPAKNMQRPWVAAPAPATNRVDGLDFVLDPVTVRVLTSRTNDIWNHVVTIPTEVWKDGVLLTNWGVTFGAWADASGNSMSVIQYHRSLDPRFVWKLDLDFGPLTNFPPGSVVTMAVPDSGQPVTTNVLGLPVTVSFNGQWIDATLATNAANVALRFVGVADATEAPGRAGSSSWDQHRFRAGSFTFNQGGVWRSSERPATVALAVVPNIHTTFYTQAETIDEVMK